MMYWNDGGNDWGMALMMISALISWLVVIAVIVYVVPDRASRQAPEPPPSASDPQQLLAERYARGEIDDEEFRRRSDVLAGKVHDF
jgi:putative membrane protein